MVKLTSKLAVVKSRLPQLLPEDLIHRVCRDAGHAWRNRLLTPGVTVHLMLLQLLARVAMIGVGRVAQVTVSAAAIGKARMRLPRAVWQKLADGTALWNATRGLATYCGLTTYIADGTTLVAADTPAMVKALGRSPNPGKAKTGLAMPRILALMNAVTGAITGVLELPPGRGEQSMLTRLLGRLGPKSLLLGDAGLIGFAQFAFMRQMGVQFVMRLARNKTVKGRGKGIRRRIKRLGKGGNLVRWSRPERRPKWINGVLWKNLPASLELRQIAIQLVRPGFQTTWAWIVTDLTDDKKYTAASLAELYGKRYGIELAFRQLKKYLKMERLSAKTPAGVRKEILAFVVLYNLVQRLINDAAKRQKVPPDRISFTDAARVLLDHPPDQPVPDLKLNPKRKRPNEPRARKHGGQRFPQLKTPRKQGQSPPVKVRVGGEVLS
jgi:putative transposase